MNQFKKVISWVLDVVLNYGSFDDAKWLATVSSWLIKSQAIWIVSMIHRLDIELMIPQVGYGTTDLVPYLNHDDA